MRKQSSLKAAAREGSGKGSSRKLRGTGLVPAVLYGHGEQSRQLSVDAHDLGLLMSGISVDNTLVRLEIEGEGPQDVLIREVQRHPYRPEVLHVDFFHVNVRETLHVKIPVRLLGTPVGVHTGGGVLDQVLYDVEVECLPRDIPDSAEVDVSHLEVGESVRVGDLKLANVKVLQDAELAIASVLAPTKAVEEEEVAAAATEEPAEPELVRPRRGEEEGE